MRSFALLEAETIDEAVAEAAHPSTTLFAGGVALLLVMRERLLTPERILWLGRCEELTRVQVDAEGVLHLGPLLTHAAVAAHPLVRLHAPLLAQAAAQVGDPQIRHMGTLGGNLCHADPQSDPPAALVAEDATMRVRGSGGVRTIAAHDFFTGYYSTALEPGEVLVDVMIPPRADEATSVFHRLTLPFDDRPIVTVGLEGVLRGENFVEIRIAVGAATAAPTRVVEAESHLKSHGATAPAITEAAELAVRAIQALEDHRGSAGYRRHLTRVLVTRMLNQFVQANTHA